MTPRSATIEVVSPSTFFLLLVEVALPTTANDPSPDRMAQSTGEVESAKAPPKTFHLAGSKLRKKLSSSLQEHAAAPTSDFAQKQLQKMGWSHGEGLGKRKNGVTTHIRVNRRAENTGLGAEKKALEEQQQGESWWKDGFAERLAALSKKKEKKVYTDEELFEATGGARFSMRAAPTKKLAKWRRAEGDVQPSKASGSETDEAEALTKEEKKARKAAKKKRKEEKRKRKSMESDGDVVAKESKKKKAKKQER